MLFFWLKCIKPRPNRFSETGFHGWFNNLKLFITLEVKPTIKIIFRKFGWLRFPTYRIIFSHTIHVWYIYLHLVDFYGKCREIYTIHGWYGFGKNPAFKWSLDLKGILLYTVSIHHPFLRGISLSVESLPSKKKINFGRFFTFVWST